MIAIMLLSWRGLRTQLLRKAAVEEIHGDHEYSFALFYLRSKHSADLDLV